MERQLQRESWDVICFGGEETLCLAKFAQHITNNLERLTPYIVHVEGRYLKDNSKASVLGKLKESNKNINGYIRNIRIEDLYERDEAKREKGLSVGCSNATLEDIAADRVSFFFFGEPDGRQVCILDRHYIYYAVRPIQELSEERMSQFRDSGQYLNAIAVAKRLGNDAAKDLLISYLKQKYPTSADMKEMAAEAFRSLEELCKRDSESSQQTTDALIGYIKNNITTPACRNSVIYAIEALGFVANHQAHQKTKVRRYLSHLLESCDKNIFRDNPAIYWHIVWASLVVFDRTMHSALKIKVIQELEHALDDRKTLAEIGPEKEQEVVKDLMRKVIRLHTQAVKQAPPEPLPIAIGPGKVLHILHLSDIHLGTQEQASNYLNELVSDLNMGLALKKFDKLDYLVISGDITSNSTREEYEAACLLINGLMENYQLDSDHIVIVPGNHDLNWYLSKKAYGFYFAGEEPVPYGPEDCIIAGDQGTLIRQYPDYYRRFDHFSSFLYNKIYGKGYSLEPDYQAQLFKQADDRVVFLALNSCWNIDHHFCNRSGICVNSLNNALAGLIDPAYNTWLKIAVWHHPVTRREAMDDNFLQQLTQHRFHVCMHGHIHQAIQGFHYRDPNRNLNFIGAGTFGACAAQRVPGVPMQYNLIKYDPNDHQMTVNTRKKNTKNTPWMPDYLWDDGNGGLIPYYRFKIQFPSP